MTVIVDTGVSYADHDTDASRHNAATNAVEAVYSQEVWLFITVEWNALPDPLQ